jgi:hypothetical protein
MQVWASEMPAAETIEKLFIVEAQAISAREQR